MSNPLHILLSRLGDITNFLPVLYHLSQNGSRPGIMVCKEYTPLFDGVSYCDVVPFDGTDWEIERAYNEALRVNKNVRVSTVNGPIKTMIELAFRPAGYDVSSAGELRMATDSFVKESWNLAGHFDLWKTQPPLVFDRRDKAREDKLAKQVLPKGKKVILVAAKGKSSPFPYHELLFEILKLKFGKRYAIVDIGQVQAERFYDLLGLYERAHCLIATDSAPLHLAYACKDLPVVALVNDKPSLWHGSAWRPNHIEHIRYSDFPNRAPAMLRAIEGIKEPGSWFADRVADEQPRIIHAWSAYEVNDENRERHLEAVKTWQTEYASGRWIACPSHVGAFGKDSHHSSIADKKRYPYLLDVIRLAMYRAEDDDVICLTRCDTSFKQLFGTLFPAYAHRSIVTDGVTHFHPAVDLFAFTKKWWREHQRELPTDNGGFIMGQDYYWWQALLDVFKRNGARELPFAVFRKPSTERVKTEPNPKRVQYNESLYAKHFKDRTFALYPKVHDQLPTYQINRHALFPYGYNGSLIRFQGRLLLAYRYHDAFNASTALAMAELDEHFNVKSNAQIRVVGRSVEDPRLVIGVEGDLCMSFVDSTYPDIQPKSVVKFGKLTEQNGEWTVPQPFQHKFGGANDMSSMQKNWVYFPFEDAMFCIYQCSPKQVIFNNTSHVTTDALTWPWGASRGGTVPLPYKGKLLRFFHSALDNEPPNWRRRYYVGAMLMEPEPPFQQIAISKRPVLYGSELDDMSTTEKAGTHHFKAKVVFPMGAVAEKDQFLISCGINDSGCAVVRVSEKDLNL